MRRIWLCGLLCLTGLARAATPLSLAQAVQTALGENPVIAGADAEVEATRATLAQVRGAGRLQAALDAGYTVLQDPMNLDTPPITLNLGPLGSKTVTIPAIPLAKSSMWRATLSAQALLYSGDRIPAGMAQAQAGVEALQARAQSVRREVAYGVVQAYLSAVLAARVAAVADEAYATVTAHAAEAERLLQAGMIPGYEVTRAKTEVANQDRRRLDAHTQAELALATLAELLGRGDADFTLTTPLDGTHPDAEPPPLPVAWQASTDRQALEAKDRVYRAAVREAWASLHPYIAVIATTELYRDDLPLTTPDGYLALVAHLPLTDGGVARAKAAEQQALRAENRDALRQTRDVMQLHLRQDTLALTNARKALETADQGVALAQESLRLATRRFAVGAGTGVEQMDALLALSVANTQVAQARYAYDLAYYGMKKEQGTLLAVLTAEGAHHE